MTTVTALNSTEVIVRNNGRVVRVPVLNLINVDEAVASCARAAVKCIGAEITVPGDNRRPRHARVHGLLQ